MTSLKPIIHERRSLRRRRARKVLPRMAINHSDTLFDSLQALGAGEFEHLNGSLAAHLRGTESLLRSWGARNTLCKTGLFHAVYGTDGYNPALAGLEMRTRISTLIGAEAEQLAYLYGACNRAIFYPRIGTGSQLLLADRFREDEYDITLSQLQDLCELILANELEIAISSAAFKARYRAKLSALFERMQGLVSEAGFQTFRSVLC